MFLTRLGFGSKMVVTGDITQVDLPRDQQSGPDRRRRHPRGGRGRRVRALRRRGRRAPPARAAHRRGLRRARPARQAPELRPRPSAPAMALRSRCSTSRSSAAVAPTCRGREIERLVALALASAGVDDGHVAVAFVERRADRRAQRRAPRQGRADRRAVVPDRRGRPTSVAGPRELGDVVICPPHTEDLREAIVHGALHLVGHGPRDRRRRDARAPGGAAAW